jgi:hypothetical protein
MAEREAGKRMESARNTWAALLRAIFVRMSLEGKDGEPPKGSTAAKKTAAKRPASRAEPGDSPARLLSRCTEGLRFRFCALSSEDTIGKGRQFDLICLLSSWCSAEFLVLCLIRFMD